MGDEQRNLETVRLLAERWNAGDPEGVLDLYTHDVQLVVAPEWPDPGPEPGKAALARFMADWRSAWETVEMDVGDLQAEGDTVVATGDWDSRGSVSGLDGRIPFGVVFTLRAGLVARLEWFMDPEEARRAAG